MKKKKLVGTTTKKSLHRLSKSKAIAAFLIVAFGISMIPTTIFLDNTIQDEIDKAIAEQITVPDPEDDDYEEWKSNDYKDAIPYYSNYYLWNLTNPIEYLLGYTPIYEEIGPYVFREYETKYNVRFSDDGEEVSYNSYSTYEFDQGRSGTLSLYDQITNINPGYLGVLDMTTTERNLIGLMAPIVFSTVKETFMDEFSEKMSTQSTWDDIWDQVYIEVTSGIAERLSGIVGGFVKVSDAEKINLTNKVLQIIKENMPSSLDVFLMEWSHGKFPDISNNAFAGLMVRAELKTWVKVVTTVLVWILAIFFPILIPVAVATTVVVFVPIIQDCEMEKELIGDQIEEQSHNEIIQELDFDKIFFEDIYDALLLGDKNSISPDSLSFDPDFGDANDLFSCAYTPLWKSDKIWSEYDNYSLIGEEGDIWYDAACGDEESTSFLKERFDLTDSEMNGISNWLNEAADSWLKNICGYTIQNMSSGLITTRTVDEWLFSAEDDFIEMVEPELAKVNIFDNCHNTTEADEAEANRYKINTGKKNVEKVGQTIEFNGEEEISMWARGINVEGTDGTQFAPGVSKDESLDVFVPELVRPVEFKYSKLTNMYDIELFRYEFSEDLFEPAPEYFMDTEGLANMYPEYGIPVYLSKPHFLDAEESVGDAVIGMDPKSSKHNTYIDVEPITGITMKAKARIQVNFKVSPTDKWYSDVQEAYMPILWVEKEAEITEEKAEEFKDSLYGALDLRSSLIPALIGGGSIITFIGAMFSQTQVKKHRLIVAQHIRKKYGEKKLLNFK